MSIFGKTKQEKAEEIVIAYLEEKYGQDFTPAGTYGQSSGTLEMYVTCDSLPGEKIHVYADNWKSADRVIRDNYLMYKYADQILEYIREQVSTEFAHTVIHWAVVDRTLSPELPADATMEQVLKDDRAKLYVQVDVLEGELTDMEQVRRIIERVQADVTDYDFLFISIEKEHFGKLTNQELISRFNADDMVCGAVSYRINGRTQEAWCEPKE